MIECGDGAVAFREFLDFEHKTRFDDWTPLGVRWFRTRAAHRLYSDTVISESECSVKAGNRNGCAQNPTFTVTATAIAALPLGMGATTTIFSIVNTLLLRSLPVLNAERFVALGYRTVRFYLECLGRARCALA